MLDGVRDKETGGLPRPIRLHKPVCCGRRASPRRDLPVLCASSRSRSHSVRFGLCRNISFIAHTCYVHGNSLWVSGSVSTRRTRINLANERLTCYSSAVLSIRDRCGSFSCPRSRAVLGNLIGTIVALVRLWDQCARWTIHARSRSLRRASLWSSRVAGRSPRRGPCAGRFQGRAIRARAARRRKRWEEVPGCEVDEGRRRIRAIRDVCQHVVS